MLDLVDSLLVILDLCFALICTPIGELHLHHFVFYCSMIGLGQLSEPASLHSCNMSLMRLLRCWSYADFQSASAGLMVDVHSRLRGSANASLSHSLLRALIICSAVRLIFTCCTAMMCWW